MSVSGNFPLFNRIAVFICCVFIVLCLAYTIVTPDGRATIDKAVHRFQRQR